MVELCCRGNLEVLGFDSPDWGWFIDFFCNPGLKNCFHSWWYDWTTLDLSSHSGNLDHLARATPFIRDKLRYLVLPGLICNLLSFLKMCPSAFRVSSPQAQGGGGGVKPAPKPSLDWWGCARKISSRSVQGFGFPLALHIPTDRQTDKHPIFIKIDHLRFSLLVQFQHLLILVQLSNQDIPVWLWSFQIWNCSCNDWWSSPSIQQNGIFLWKKIKLEVNF